MLQITSIVFSRVQCATLTPPWDKSGVAAYLHSLVIVFTSEPTALYGDLKQSCMLTIAVCCCPVLPASSSANQVLQAQGLSGTARSTAVLWATAVQLCSKECTGSGQQHALLVAADSVGLWLHLCCPLLPTLQYDHLRQANLNFLAVGEIAGST